MLKFQLGDKVLIGPAEVRGEIVGYTVYAEKMGCHSLYLVRFTNPQTFLPTEDWFNQDLLESGSVQELEQTEE